MKLELHFSEDEMIDYLNKNNYEIADVDTWYSENIYHNKVMTLDCKVKIAYKPSVGSYVFEKISGKNRTQILSEHGVEKVFKELIKHRILSIERKYE
jgi:hypothetical protein